VLGDFATCPLGLDPDDYGCLTRGTAAETLEARVSLFVSTADRIVSVAKAKRVARNSSPSKGMVLIVSGFRFVSHVWNMPANRRGMDRHCTFKTLWWPSDHPTPVSALGAPEKMLRAGI